MSVNSVPVEIVQGTTHTWEVSEPDYPSSSWTLTYVFRSSRQSQTVTATASGGGYSVTLTKAVTAALYTGPFAWQAFVVNSGNTIRHNLASGVVNILPDNAVDQTPPFDARSIAKQRLENLNEMLGSNAFVKTLDGLQIEALERVRKQAEWDVKRETDAEKLRAGGYPTRKILTRFA